MFIVFWECFILTKNIALHVTKVISLDKVISIYSNVFARFSDLITHLPHRHRLTSKLADKMS